jgi:hypothetical protein
VPDRLVQFVRGGVRTVSLREPRHPPSDGLLSRKTIMGPQSIQQMLYICCSTFAGQEEDSRIRKRHELLIAGDMAGGTGIRIQKRVAPLADSKTN